MKGATRMTTLSAAEATDILAGLGEVKAGLTTLTGEVHLHGEILMRIVELLTPKQDHPETPLHELLAALIGRLDRQSVMLKEILEGQTSLRRGLPLEVVQAIDDSHGAGGSVAKGAPGDKPNGANGHGAGQQP
jgi:hypothetical protein